MPELHLVFPLKSFPSRPQAPSYRMSMQVPWWPKPPVLFLFNAQLITTLVLPRLPPLMRSR